MNDKSARAPWSGATPVDDYLSRRGWLRMVATFM